MALKSHDGALFMASIRGSGVNALLVMIGLLLASGMLWPLRAEETAEAQETHGDAAKPVESLAAPGFLRVPALNVPVVKQNQVRRMLAVKLVLDIEAQDAMDQAAQLLPRLNADYASALAKWSNRFQDPREPANVIAIKQQLQQVTNRVLARDDVIVLLQHALMQ